MLMLKNKEKKQYLKCGCCGNDYLGCIEKDEKGLNVYDEGFGMCPDCGGDPKAKSIKKKLGWAACTFYEARFEIIRKNTNEKNRAKFNGLSYLQKVYVIRKLIEQGTII